MTNCKSSPISVKDISTRPRYYTSSMIQIVKNPEPLTVPDTDKFATVVVPVNVGLADGAYVVEPEIGA